jgi:hypothetical protein
MTDESTLKSHPLVIKYPYQLRSNDYYHFRWKRYLICTLILIGLGYCQYLICYHIGYPTAILIFGIHAILYILAPFLLFGGWDMIEIAITKHLPRSSNIEKLI